VNRCLELREQLEDLALGGTATAELSGHLDDCPACAAELERQRALMRRLDDAIDAIVRVEPPPQLLAGVAARLRPARRASPSSAVRRRITAWALVAACALLLAIGLRTLERPHAPRSELSALTEWRSPTASLLQPPRTPVDAYPAPRASPGGTHGS